MTDWKPNQYKSYKELEQALRAANVESIQMIIGFDFSRSNEWSGEVTYQNRCLHDTTFVNPYLHVLNILEPIVPRFDDDGIYPAYRFGCVDSEELRILPLGFPDNKNPEFNGFAALKEAYLQAAKTVQMSGPTTFTHMVQQAIQYEKEQGGTQLIFLVIITDGDVADISADKAAIIEASKYPISICAVGVGDGPFEKMIEFDDFDGRAFDNFQFVDFTAFETKLAGKPNQELELATLMFNELPDHVESMKKLGYM